MTPADPRLAWYAAAVDKLAAFLLSDPIVWPLDRKAGLRQDLSLGGLLLLQDELRVEAAHLSPEDRRLLEDLDRRWEVALREHASALARKAIREQAMRLHLWSAYLAELEERPAAGEYPQQVRHRVMLERLGDLSARPSATEPVDLRLRSSFQAGPFLWPAALQPLYPKDRYWFLYGALAARL